jgi:filamentous hemagglutinin family protein
MRRTRTPLPSLVAALRLGRGALLATTALQAGFALAFALPATAQPAPDARPQGGAVVAGQASIAHGANTTTITQATDRAAINWRSFDVGRDQRVRFEQPGASSMTLNRVTGPNPSEIAGRIQANGGVVVINGAGVVFHRGAQVEAHSFIASTADTTNAAFMAGRLQFDRPGRPGARIENRGDISVRETGLAALVAPNVANAGTIRARLGTVVLAGAETHTIDLHGDGLVSFDVTRQVRTAPAGGEALVTNDGTIIAEGGNVLLTARAADGLVQNLVSAGGTIRADSVGPRTGNIEISGVGGGIRVHGTLAAEGRRPGERGGTIAVNAPAGEATLGATARVVASGQAGGGTVAIGTTPARARAQGGGVPAGSARRVTVAAGARIEADATARGDGGRVAVMATERAAHAGAISARGGNRGGDGGRVEISGDRVAITGSADARAPQGAGGTLLIDPVNLNIVASVPAGEAENTPNPGSPQVGAGDPAAGGGDDAFVLAGTVTTLLGTSNVRLEASNDLTVSAIVDFATNTNSLTLAAGRNVVVDQRITLKGDVLLQAADPGITGASATGKVELNATVESTAGNVFVRSFGAGGGIGFGGSGKVAAASVATLVANTIALPTAANTVKAPTVEIAPNAGVAMTFGTGASSGLALPSLAGITRPGDAVRLGRATLPGGGLTTLASDVTLVGNAALGGAVLELAGTGAVSRSGGTLSGVASLTGSAGTGFAMDGASHVITEIGAITSAAGRVSLKLSGDRTIGTLLTLPTAPDGFHIEAAGALSVPDPISIAGTIALTGSSVTTSAGAALTSTGGAVVLTGTGAGGVAINDAINAGTRIGIRADTFDRNGQTLTTPGTGTVEIARHSGGAQTVSDLGGAATGTLRLGAVTAPFAATPTTTATSLDLAASPAAPGFATLDLRASGAVSQSVPLDLTGVTLTGRAGSVTLNDVANSIPRLGAITTTAGDVSIRTAGALEIAGALNAGASDILLRSGGTTTLAAAGSASADNISLRADAGDIVLKGSLDTVALLTLEASGAAGGDGAIAAETIRAKVGSLDIGATIPVVATTLADISANAGVAIVLAGDATVAGTVQSGAVANGDLAITAATLDITGSVIAGVAGVSGGDVGLTAPAGIASSGTIRARAFGGVGGDIAMGAASGAISQTGGSIVAAGTLDLAAGGAITQPGGTMDAATLSASAAADGASLSLARDNRFDTLGAVTVAGSITLNNAIALAIAGPVRGGQAPVGAAPPGAPVTVSVTAAGAMTVGGAVAAGQSGVAGAPDVAGNIVLISADGLTRAGAASDAALDIAPTASLATVRLGALGGQVTMQAESANPAAGLIGVRAPLAVAGSGAFSLLSNSVTVGGGPAGIGSLSAPLGSIAVKSDGLTLEGVPAGGFNLAAPTVVVAPRAAGTAISLGAAGAGLDMDAAALSRIAADLLEVGRPDGGDVTLVAAAPIGGVTTLRVLGAGDLLAAPGAVLTVGRLEATLGGDMLLDAPGGPHAVGALGAISAGTVGYRGAGSVAVDGAIAAGANVTLATGAGGTLQVLGTGSITAGSGGVVTLAGDLFSLAGPVSAPGGRIEILPATAGRAITLGGAGGLSLLQADLDRLAAPVLLLGARDGGPAVGGDLTVAGLVDLTGHAERLRLLISGNAGDGGSGTGIRVTSFGDTALGPVANANAVAFLTGEHRIGTLDAFATTGGFALGNETALVAAGPVEAGGLIRLESRAAGATALQLTGSLAGGTIGGVASGGAGHVLLETTQGGLTIGGAAAVLARGGAVSIHGASSGTGAVTTIAAGADVVAGLDATIRGDAGLVIAGMVEAQTGVVLHATGATPALDLQAAGSVRTATGDITLVIPGTGEAALGGTLTATAGNLVLNGGAVGGAGAVDADAVTGTARSLALTGTANRIGALDTLTTTVGGIAVNSLDPLAVQGLVSSAGAVTLSAPSLAVAAGATLSAPGEAIGLTATTGGILADGEVNGATLSGSAATSAAFNNAANAVGTLGDFTVGTSFLFRGATALAVSGDVAAPSGIDIATGGTLTLTSALTASGGAVALATTAGDIVQSAGTIEGTAVTLTAAGAATQTAGTLRATATDVAVTGASVGLAGTLDAARDIAVSATAGGGSLSGSVTAGEDLTVSVTGGALALSGTLSAGGLAQFDATGGITQAGTLDGAAGIAMTASGGDVSVGGTLTASGGAITLGAGAGDIVQSAGTIEGTAVTLTAAGAATQTAGTLRATATDIAVTGASVGLAGTLDAARDIIVSATAGGGSLSGSVTAGEDLTVSVTGGALALSGTLSAGGLAQFDATGGITQAGTLDGAAGIAMTASGGDVSVGGTLTASGGAIALGASAGNITQSAGTIEGTAVTLTAAGAATQTAGTLRATATDIAVTGASVGLAGTLDAAAGINLTATSGNGTITGTATAGGSLAVDASAGFLTIAGIITGSQVTFDGGSGIAHTAATTAIVDRVTLNSGGGSVSIGGTVIGDVLASAAGDILLPGRIDSYASTQLTAGAMIAGGGIIATPLLAGAAGGDISLTGVNLIGSLGNLAAGGNLTVNNAAPLAVAGAMTAGGVLSLDVAGALTLNNLFGTPALAAPAIVLNAASIAQLAGRVETGALNAMASGSIAMTLPDNRINGVTGTAGGGLALATDSALTLTGPVTAGGALDLAASGALTVPSGVTANAGTAMALRGSSLTLAGDIAAPVLAFTATAGDIVQNAGAIAWTSGASLAAPGAIEQAGGRLNGAPGAPLSGSAGLGFRATAAGNRVAALGPFSAGSGIALTTGGDLVIVGGLASGAGTLALSAGGTITLLAVPVTAASGEVSAGGSVIQQPGGVLAAGGALGIGAGLDIALGGTVTADPLRLAAGRDIVQPASGALATGTLTLAAGRDVGIGGSITAGTVTGSAGGAMTLDGPAIRVALLRDVAAGSRIVVLNDAALTVRGAVSAPSVIIRADGPLSIDDVRLTTAGVSYAEPPPGPLTVARLPEPVPGTPGAVFETTSPSLDISELTVIPIGGNATLALRLPATGGALTIAGNTLIAPDADVVFDLGAGGSAIGRIDVRNLTILGGGGRTELEGLVRGFDGEAAASLALIGPQFQADYRINNCPVGSVNCVLILVQIPVTTNPLGQLGIVATRDDSDDPDVLIPNVAERDF